jgi:hypothetical protein
MSRAGMDPPEGSPRRVTRRDVLRAAIVGAAVAGAATADDRPVWHDAVVADLERLGRPDGGYAWEDQEASHLTSTYAVIGC